MPDDYKGIQYLGTEDPNATLHWDDRGAREVSLQPAVHQSGPSLSGPAPSYSVAHAGMGGTSPAVAMLRADHVASKAPTAQDYEAIVHQLEQAAMRDQASLRRPSAVEPTVQRYRMQDDNPYPEK